MNDEHEGLGGSYMLGPKTGKRTLVARTEPPAPAEAQTPEPADAGFSLPVASADTPKSKE
jgi:hypothetical protein